MLLPFSSSVLQAQPLQPRGSAKTDRAFFPGPRWCMQRVGSQFIPGYPIQELAWNIWWAHLLEKIKEPFFYWVSKARNGVDYIPRWLPDVPLKTWVCYLPEIEWTHLRRWKKLPLLLGFPVLFNSAYCLPFLKTIRWSTHPHNSWASEGSVGRRWASGQWDRKLTLIFSASGQAERNSLFWGVGLGFLPEWRSPPLFFTPLESKHRDLYALGNRSELPFLKPGQLTSTESGQKSKWWKTEDAVVEDSTMAYFVNWPPEKFWHQEAVGAAAANATSWPAGGRRSLSEAQHPLTFDGSQAPSTSFGGPCTFHSSPIMESSAHSTLVMGVSNHYDPLWQVNKSAHTSVFYSIFFVYTLTKHVLSIPTHSCPLEKIWHLEGQIAI